jgi:hypothetical protein
VVFVQSGEVHAFSRDGIAQNRSRGEWMGKTAYVGEWMGKTAHVSEWMIISSLPQRWPRTYESHQRELVDRSFKLEDAPIEDGIF